MEWLLKAFSSGASVGSISSILSVGDLMEQVQQEVKLTLSFLENPEKYLEKLRLDSYVLSLQFLGTPPLTRNPSIN